MNKDNKKSFAKREQEEAIFDKLDVKLYKQGPPRLGWLYNASQELVQTGNHETGQSTLDLFFLESNGVTRTHFRCTLKFYPYFYVQCLHNKENDVLEYLQKTFEKYIYKITVKIKKDLKKPNHLVNGDQKCVKLEFWNTQDLTMVRNKLIYIVKGNQKKSDRINIYETQTQTQPNRKSKTKEQKEKPVDHIFDIQEYDIPHYQRAAIDLDIRIGLWYKIQCEDDQISLQYQETMKQSPIPIILAFDILTTKRPLNFPDPDSDSIMMISYIINNQGYVITNRKIVSEDIRSIKYIPPRVHEYQFNVFNERDEVAVISRFFLQVRKEKPTIITTFNGDAFDWPFIEKRSELYGLNMQKAIGFTKTKGFEKDEYISKISINIDCLFWVKRDSHLPPNSQSLKSVVESKLGYSPDDLDPEILTECAKINPQTLAHYSMSETAATYYLYIQHIHPFIFSLCSIIPMNPEEILRTPHRENIIIPQKYENKEERFFNDHFLQDESFIGGHTEILETGVFRSDLPVNFKIEPQTIEKLIFEIDNLLSFSIWESFRKTDKNLKDSAFNVHDKIRSLILSSLEEIKCIKQPYERLPLIYCLDINSMYLNIILTNRLQPGSMITKDLSQKSDFNIPGKICDRKMKWFWRAEFYPANMFEYETIKKQLNVEKFPPKLPGGNLRSYHQLSSDEQLSILKNRLDEFCLKEYQSKKEMEVREKQALICQRENPFYLNAVLNFRDLLHKYKAVVKDWKNKLSSDIKKKDHSLIEESKKMIIQYDTLYLAHQNIFNSFYKSIVCKGSRWYSIEMAGVVCDIGSNIIKMARKLIEKIGRPLKIETDRIWCILPSNFPENYTFNLSSGNSITISYPRTILNYLVHLHFTNDQYYNLSTNKQRKENNLFFDINGPHRAIILPSPSHENTNTRISEEHVIFNNSDADELHESKGFEINSYGGFKFIKNFQKDIFKAFLKGETLEECHFEVRKVANTYLDIIKHKGSSITEKEVIEYFSEERSMSHSSENSEQKLMIITASKRLAELIGDQVKANKLICHYIVSSKPSDLLVSERVIPVAVFFSEDDIKMKYLRRWIENHSANDFNVHNILDWEYYKECLTKIIQKFITIPKNVQDNKRKRVDEIISEENNSFQNIKTNTYKRRRISKNISDESEPSLEILFINKESVWEIIQIIETDTPGKFIMWILVGREIQIIHLNVSRRFYINYKLDTFPTKIKDMIKSNGSITKVNRILPESHKQFNLFEVTMQESTYQENSVILQDIFNDPLIEGVYENQINLLDRALIEVGFMIDKCLIEPNVLKDSITNGLDIRDIGKCENLPADLYLMGEPTERPINFLYLYHAVSEDNNHLYGLFSSCDNKVHVFYVGLKAVAMKYSEERYAFMYKEFIESIGEIETSANIFKIQNEIEIKITYLIRDIKEFAKALSNEIKKHEQARYGPTILVLQSNYSSGELIGQGVDILRKFPTINIMSCDRFNTFSSAAEPMFARYIQINSIINNLIEKSRHLKLPLSLIVMIAITGSSYAAPIIPIIREYNVEETLAWEIIYV
ncbi:6532_t:CDS:10 [Diversispora eburnea]|uniref:DNA polymerase epsilon catalytic subunit n=1 Tax=Diversispora eburnea TaxID=1213867 RepID=A0A9N9AD52_9GLOM|nr:6532_t:CDS:10 [Diversispora eburnea]